MTCIVGLVEDGVVHLAGDSAASNYSALTVRADPKVFRVGDFAIGFTTSFRMGQVLQYQFWPPPIDAGRSLYAYMVTQFVEALRCVMRDAGVTATTNGVERCGIFLVGVRGKLYQIDSDFQVGEAVAGYDAVGSGEAYAQGALYATRGQAARQRLTVALEAAAEHSPFVRGPWQFVEAQG